MSRQSVAESSDSESAPLSELLDAKNDVAAGGRKRSSRTSRQLENFALLPSDTDEDSDVPLTKRQKKKSASTNNNSESDGEEDDNDESFAEEQVKSKKRGSSKQAVKSVKKTDADKKPTAKTAKKSNKISNQSIKSKKSMESHNSSSENDSDVPLSKRRRAKESSDENDDAFQDDTPKKPKKTTAKKVKREATLLAKKPRKTSAVEKNSEKVKVEKVKKEKPDQPEEEESFKWWLEQDKDDSIKWSTLEHQGPAFAPPYQPHGIQMKYNGKAVKLNPESEEVATFFAALIGTDYATNATFVKNFFTDFLKVLENEGKTCPIKEFEKCDFTPITDYLNIQKEKKKAMTKAEKDEIKKQKAEVDAIFGFCLLDGRREKVGNFRIEPPGLFRGRGDHPKTGSLKQRVRPEQVTINIGKDDKVPVAPEGHSWGEITHDNTVSWLAMWKENVNDNFKYIFLAATSSLKGMSDMKKFEKARELKIHAERIRGVYTEELKDKVMAIRQRATAMYLIDRLALRAGNEKGEDEADTVGCCSLRYEHITLEPPNKIIFDFLGKDSIRYYNEVEVDEQVFKNLKLFKKEPKTIGDPLFDRLNTGLLNKYLTTQMKGLSAKVFRTYNAELKKTDMKSSVPEKILAYNRANREVAILCNHQRSVPKSHNNQLSRIQERIMALKYEKSLVRKELLQNDPKLKKSCPELTEVESDLDEEAIELVLKMEKQRNEEKLVKKLEKTNKDRAAEGESLLTLADLQKDVKKSQPAQLSIEKLEKKLIGLADKIKAQKLLLLDKDEGKTTALSTSKINYIDPRISVAWCKKYDVPVDKILNRALREKFKWALDIDADWEF